MAFWNENLQNAGWVRRKMSSLALRWPPVKAIEEIQNRSYSRGKGSGFSGGRGKEKWNGASAADDVDHLVCAEGEGALVVMI